MFNRRKFVKTVSLTPFIIQNGFSNASALSPSKATDEEAFWDAIAQAYSVDRSIINLNNGGVSPQPITVQNNLAALNAEANKAPSYFMWRIMDKGREPLRQKLAAMAGCLPDEIAIQRNTTEALGNIVMGLTLHRGDEVVLSTMDYPNMIQAWQQRAIREGISLVFVDLKLPSTDVDYLVKAYTNLFTSKTKVVHLTHMINWCGQLMPVAQIAAIANQMGIEVVLDAAHTFAHIPFSLTETGCHYAGTSLHKWLGAPFGTGFLFVSKQKIKNLWPLLPNKDPKSDDIRKFEVLGTRSFAVEQAIHEAIKFNENIGLIRKCERLYYLKNYWCSRVANIPGVKLNTPDPAAFSGAIAHIEINGYTAATLEAALFQKYNIHTSPIGWAYLNGVRITPNVYTKITELDVLVEAIKTLARSER
jgi:selenocysteine lyase/cysteine desulfurase